MKATGIVVEYNPFHNGHLHHAAKAKELSGADVVVAVMSGQFLQRGEPAFADKWTRTEMALSAGVDVVIELPYAFATAQASEFARGAIELLDAAGCSSFCFGSEQGEIEPFLNTLELLGKERDQYEKVIHDRVQTGISYPKALNEAYLSLTKGSSRYADLTKPNNILGYHYIEAAHTINSAMAPLTIQRIGAGFHDPLEPGVAIASATGIRNAFFEGEELRELAPYLPSSSIRLLERVHAEQQGFVDWQRFYPMLRFTILREGPKALARFAEMTEGIENLIHESAKRSETFEVFVNRVKSKRFTRTRIQRMLTHIFTGYTQQEAQAAKHPEYIRLLGMTKNGRRYLNERKKAIPLPVISRAADLTGNMGQLVIRPTKLNLQAIGSDSLKN
ncbi:MAG: nucleotidyltransferase [Planococcus sp. (in: firmicutes)]|nr:nucleotidyltransferase [Planococcus sp. (in: firmicutes)]